ncbi:MAG: hypothetical protein BMS9Abin36_0908 [Gammaproteobacteria bacterium]|nr:MAG: hypothetical protein BMS9Abin36_0908 [Gammaproteobacteria bacterium]
MASKELHVRLSGLDPSARRALSDEGAWPTLRRICGRADSTHSAMAGYYPMLAREFGLDTDAGLPVAALEALAYGEASPEYRMRADPVHLMPAGDQLVMLDQGLLSLSQDEAKGLVDEVLKLFAEDGWEIDVLRPDCWHLRLPMAPDIRTTPVDEVFGHSIQHALPVGADAMAWHRILTEVQGLLHTSEINRVREVQGDYVVNSLWFWGGGRLPKPLSSEWQEVWTNDAFATGLAIHSNIPCKPLPETLTAIEAILPEGKNLLVITLPLMSTLESMEKNWWAPLAVALMQGRLRKLTIRWPGSPVYSITSSQYRWRLWRSSVSPKEFFADAS